MKTRIALAPLLVTALAVWGCVRETGVAMVANPTPVTSTKAGTERQRGVSWVAGREVDEEEIRRLVDNHVNWIVQTPFGWQRGVDSPNVLLATSGRVLWGERDEGLETTTRLAHKHGIHTLLKPHLWIMGANGKWRADVSMQSGQDWSAWFDSYRAFILHYARLAERLGIEGLCIGTELHQTVVQHPDQWRETIRQIREVYHGKLTYAANWYREFEEIEFWDDLDFIGIQAYFPLSETENPSIDELRAGWRPHLEKIERVQKRFGKPVVFTEIGYRSDSRAAIEPWVWPNRLANTFRKADPETQALCYRAFFETCWDREWLAGVYFWKWYPRHDRVGLDDIDFTPQNKPAQQVMASWYGR